MISSIDRFVSCLLKRLQLFDEPTPDEQQFEQLLLGLIDAAPSGGVELVKNGRQPHSQVAFETFHGFRDGHSEACRLRVALQVGNEIANPGRVSRKFVLELREDRASLQLLAVRQYLPVSWLMQSILSILSFG